MASVSVRKSTALRARNGPSKLQPTRSMPLDYRYSAAANGPGGARAANGGGRRPAAAELEKEEKEGEVVWLEGDDADSPYSPKAATAEEEVGERGGGGGEVDSAAAATPRRLSPTAATSPTQDDARWGALLRGLQLLFLFGLSANQPAVLFSHTKSALATSYQPVRNTIHS